MDLLSAVKERILIADGAMGTLLADRGFGELPYSVANLRAPDLVRNIHEEYYHAGAEVIETNTFWSNRFRLEEHRRYENTRDICLMGARLAREAAPKAFILGAIGPCGKPLAPLGAIELQEAEEEFRIQAQALSEGGVDAITLETFSDLKELEMAVRVVRSVCDLPLIASKSFIEDGETLSEGLPLQVAREMASWGVDVIGMNCVVGPQRAFEIVRWMAEVGNIPISAMPTPGMPQIVRRQTLYDTTPEYFGVATARLAEAGANIIGGCCGTTPEMIAALARIKSYLDYGIFQPIQIAAIIGLRDCEEETKRICQIYQRRRDVLVAGLCAAGWPVAPPKGTMFLWAPIPEPYRELGSLEFSKLLLEKALTAVSPGIGFGPMGEG
ncbi:MAG: aminotransferase class I/II-fold pyridoxal phosphate-dependent enzyme, partial [Fimbriimonadales bacterium]|nr:aminotransferase class I/II-fold pyridoxal phosphate-dependent enzyme [Fimbriimonadales bacterium]